MKLIKMKALLLGTVVADTVNAAGEINSGCIVHVDPDNKSEDGRYSEPVVTEDAARKLELGGFAKRTGEMKLERGMLIGGVDAEVAGERAAEVSKIDHNAPGAGPSALDTRQTVNFPDGDTVRGDVQGLADADDDADAAPAPSTAATGQPAGRGRKARETTSGQPAGEAGSGKGSEGTPSAGEGGNGQGDGTPPSGTDGSGK